MMKPASRIYAAVHLAYGVLLGVLLIIALCELIGGGSGAGEFRYQGF